MFHTIKEAHCDNTQKESLIYVCTFLIASWISHKVYCIISWFIYDAISETMVKEWWLLINEAQENVVMQSFVSLLLIAMTF